MSQKRYRSTQSQRVCTKDSVNEHIDNIQCLDMLVYYENNHNLKHESTLVLVMNAFPLFHRTDLGIILCILSLGAANIVARRVSDLVNGIERTFE